MKITLLIILLSLCFWGCNKTSLKKEIFTQSKVENQISKNEDIKFTISLVDKDSDSRPSKLKINILKNNKNFQQIIYSPSTWPTIKDSLNVNQINYFVPGKKIIEGIENYHDFIIADFNFDNLEDFAILYDFGGSGGPVYSYYFQDKNDGSFKTEKTFLLNEGPFPKIIDKKSKTLTISTTKGCCKTSTTIFQLKNNKWDVISSKEEDMKQ